MTTKHQLTQLIDGVKAANGWSDPDLARNAKEHHHDLSKSNISRLRNELVSIKKELIHALAAGLRVPPAQVAIAAIESMGIPLPQYELPTPEQSIRNDTALSERDRDTLLVLLKRMRGAEPGTQPKAVKGKVSDDPKGGLPDGPIREGGMPPGDEHFGEGRA